MTNLDDNLQEPEEHLDGRLFGIKEQYWTGLWAVSLIAGLWFGFSTIFIYLFSETAK